MADIDAALRHYFESFDEEFVTVVGKTAILASFLESKVLELLWALEDKEQFKRAGLGAKGLVEECSKAASRVASPELLEELTPFLEDVSSAQHRRNGVIHSVWRRPLMDDAFGWRSVSEKQREVQEMFTKAYTPTREELLTLLDDLVRLIDQAHDLVSAADAEKSRRFTSSLYEGSSPPEQ